MKQRQIYWSFIFLVLLVTSLFANDDAILEKFNNQLDSIGLEFKMPEGYEPTVIDIEKCSVLDYQYAIKHKNKNLEVRYSVFPSNNNIKENETVFAALALTVIKNIAGNNENIIESTPFIADAAKTTFNGDWGSSTLVKSGSVFGQDYKYIMILSIYKIGSGRAYVTYLFNDYSDLRGELIRLVMSLKFKK